MELLMQNYKTKLEQKKSHNHQLSTQFILYVLVNQKTKSML
jgi:hypothetical protein